MLMFLCLKKLEPHRRKIENITVNYVVFNFTNNEQFR
jgi:phage terminase large subunit-like protein